jgi:hypothetical protein
VIDHAQALLASSPHDRYIELIVANWYGAVLKYLQHGSQRSTAPSTNDAEIKAHQQFSELYRRVGPVNVMTASNDGRSPRPSGDQRRGSEMRHRFIEPTALD